MKRRHFLAALLAIATLSLSACADLGALSGLLSNQLSFGPEFLQQQLNGEFPRSYPQMGGLVSVTLQNPRLSIPAGSDRLRVDFDVAVNKSPVGHFGLSSGVRFNASDLGVYLEQPAIESVDVPSLGGALGGNTRSMLNSILTDYARNEPVYRLTSQQLGGRTVSSTVISGGQMLVNLAQSQGGQNAIGNLLQPPQRQR